MKLQSRKWIRYASAAERYKAIKMKRSTWVNVQYTVGQKHQIVYGYVLDRLVYTKFKAWIYSVCVYRYTCLWLHRKNILGNHEH